MTRNECAEPHPTHRGRARRVGLAAALGVSVVCGPAAAAEADGAKAEALFREGKALLDDGQTDAACAKLDASWQIEQAPGTLINLAACHRRQGRTATAWAEFLRVGDMSQAAGNEARAQGARRLAAELEPSLSRLVLRITTPVPAGLVVVVDGRELPAPALGTPLPLDPGRHEIVARAPGRRAWQREVNIAAAERDLELSVPVLDTDAAEREPEAEAQASSSWLAPVGWTALGLGAAGLVVGSVLGGEALQIVSDAEQDPALCPAKRCSPAGRAELDSAEAMGNGSTIALVAGGSLAFVGLLSLLWSLDSSQADEASAQAARAIMVIAPEVGEKDLGIGAFGRW